MEPNILVVLRVKNNSAFFFGSDGRAKQQIKLPAADGDRRLTNPIRSALDIPHPPLSTPPRYITGERKKKQKLKSVYVGGKTSGGDGERGWGWGIGEPQAIHVDLDLDLDQNLEPEDT